MRNRSSGTYKHSLSVHSHSIRSNISATPSPDPPSSNPPTPRDIAQMVAPIAVGGNSLLLNMKAPAAPGPIYYDYSEDYHSLEKEVTEVFSETLPDSPMPMGFVQRIKALLEEREKAVGGQCLAPMNNPSTPRKSQHDLTVPEIAELPATPVARRITREMILAIMSPSSGLDAGMDSSLQVQADDSYSTPIVERILAPTPESSTPALTEDGESPRSRSRSVASKISVGMKTTAAIDMMEPTTRLGPSNRPQSMHSLASGMDIFIPDEPAETSLPPIRTPTPTPVPSVGLSRVLIDENEPIAERIKRHWSIRRAAAGPLRSQSAYIPGAMPVLPGRLAVPSRQFSWPVAELEGNPKGDIASSGHARRASGPLIIEPGWSPTVPVEHREQAGDKSASWCPVSPMDPDFASHAHMSPVSPPNTTLELISPAPRSSVNTTTTHLSALWSYRRPVPSNSVSSTGANEMPARKEPGHENIAADLRFSMMRSATGQLADVKEEPGLESSMDLRNSTFQFPLPRSGAVKGPFEEVRLAKTVCGSKGSKDSKDSKISSQMTRDSKFSQISQVSKLSNGSSEQRRHSSSDSPIEPPPRAISSVFKQSSTALADTRAIPSLNFSSINLLARLNEALGERRASLGSEFSDLVIATPTPDRHVSSGVMREKYRSFFKTLDDMTGAAIPDDYEAESQLQDHAEERAEEDTIVDTSNVEGNVGEERVSVYVPILRPMSPDELMEEVNRISVPSITGLTQRLSELLPSLRRYFGDTGDVVYVRDPLKETIDEIRGLGRISAGEDINTEGEDGWKSSQSRMVDELRHDDGDTGVGDAVGETDVSEEGNCVVLNVNTDTRRTPNPRNAATRPFSVPSPGIAELEGSIPSPLRLRSLSDSDIDSPAVDRLVTLAHTSRRSLLSNPSDIRPWNHDRNYPWSDGMPAIDIEFPSSALRRDVVGHRPSKLRLRLSSSEHSMSPSPNGIGGPLTSNPPTIASSNDTVPAAITHRRMSKHSVLGSISRKLLHTSPGNTLTNGSSSAASPVDHSGFLNGPDLLRGEERTVDPGDRYPTTGLSPPSHLINMDEVQSFFSDDSSATGRDRRNGQRKRGNSFRKRFTTGLRGRLPGGQHPRAVRERPATACEALHRVNHHPPEASHESLLVPSREGATSAGAAGMSRTEFRAKKLVDKLKVLLWRGGELLRTMSGRRKNNHGLDGTEEEGWSEIGASGLDLFEAPEYDAGATVMSDGIGSRHDSAIATNMMVVNTTAVKDPIAAE